MRRLLLALGILLACSVSAYAQISADARKDCGFATTTNTCSYTVGSGTTAMVCGLWVSGGDNESAFTWNTSENLTQITKHTDGQGTIYLYKLANPSTGTHNIVASSSTVVNVGLLCATYKGTDTGTIVDGTNFNTASDGTGTNPSITIAVTAATTGDWVFTFGSVHAGAGSPTMTNACSTTIQTGASYQGGCDTGLVSGSVTTGINAGANSDLEIATVAIKAGSGGSTPGCKNGLLMNEVGCLAR